MENAPNPERRELLDVMTQKTRFTLIQGILAHPDELPALKELDHANPSKSESTIRNHLSKLQNSGIVETYTLPKDERERDLPWRFFGLSQPAYHALEDSGLLQSEETLKEMYEMLDKPPDVERYMKAPRPSPERMAGLE